MYLYHTQGHLAKNLKSPSQKLEKEAPDDNDSEGDDKQIITTSLPEPKNQLSFSVVTFSSPPPSPFLCTRGKSENSTKSSLGCKHSPFVMDYLYCDMILDFPDCGINELLTGDFEIYKRLYY